MPELPEYRLRLFLSADLVGSTAYKADKSKQELVNDRITPQWVSEFKKFYAEFPRTVRTEYNRGGANLDGVEAEHMPVIWKTIGDELILCARVLNIEHLANLVTCFIKSLNEYSQTLKNDTNGKLDIKGNAWVAACPVPNIGFAIRPAADVEDSDLETSEKIERVIDMQPYRFDFLGKAIDTGFRIARNSTADRCTVSVQLAYLLALAKTDRLFNYELDFDGRAELKGVNDNIPYPILFIDTEKDTTRRMLRDREKAISGKTIITPLNLKDFLETFMVVASIEQPYLARRGVILQPENAPETYRNFAKGFNKSLEGLPKQEATFLEGERDSGTGEGTIDSSALDDIPSTDFTDLLGE